MADARGWLGQAQACGVGVTAARHFLASQWCLLVTVKEVKVHLSVYRGQGVGEHVTHLCLPWLRSSALVKPITIAENRRREPELW